MSTNYYIKTSPKTQFGKWIKEIYGDPDLITNLRSKFDSYDEKLTQDDHFTATFNYDERIHKILKELKSKKIKSIKTKKDLLVSIENTVRPIFNHISKKNYPIGIVRKESDHPGYTCEKVKPYNRGSPVSSVNPNQIPIYGKRLDKYEQKTQWISENNCAGSGRDNHGSFNHIRSITLALRLYFILTSTQNFSSPYFSKRGGIHAFCVIMASYFVALARVNENSYPPKPDTVGWTDEYFRKLQFNNKKLKTWFPKEWEFIKNFQHYGQNLHQLASTLMYINIMKELIPDEKFHGHIEKCGFAISFYHNDEDDKLFDTPRRDCKGSKETINDFFFLHYFISTPHYIDHCRGPYSQGICDHIPWTLFTSMPHRDPFIRCNDEDRKGLITHLYGYGFKMILENEYEIYNHEIDWESVRANINTMIESKIKNPTIDCRDPALAPHEPPCRKFRHIRNKYTTTGPTWKRKDYPGESQKFSELWEFVVLNSTESILDMSNLTEKIKKSKKKGTKKKKASPKGR